jgi:hypothetical protein
LVWLFSVTFAIGGMGKMLVAKFRVNISDSDRFATEMTSQLQKSATFPTKRNSDSACAQGF